MVNQFKSGAQAARITLKKDGTIEIKGKDISFKGSGEINSVVFCRIRKFPN